MMILNIQEIKHRYRYTPQIQPAIELILGDDYAGVGLSL
jgi:hypothetical protein